MEINNKTPQEEMQDLTQRIETMTDTITGTDCEYFYIADVINMMGEIELLSKELESLHRSLLNGDRH